MDFASSAKQRSLTIAGSQTREPQSTLDTLETPLPRNTEGMTLPEADAFLFKEKGMHSAQSGQESRSGGGWRELGRREAC